MPDAHFTIQAVAKRTGLTTHVIRIWEKRYRAVKPERTGTNRRLYSEEEIERLSLLRDITRSGHSIGPVARLPTETLRKLASESAGERPVTSTERRPGATSLLDECVAAVTTLDAVRLEQVLKRAETELGSQGLLQRVVAPLARTIGDLWRDGTITAAHEHFASGVIRLFLGHAARPFAAAHDAPGLIVTTPTGQLHELGALLVGAAAANLGWRVLYLGASLPAAEIAGAARQNRARAVALSLVYPEDDPGMKGELTRLRELLPAGTPVLAGGRAMPAYRDALDKIGALQVNDLSNVYATLEALRKPSKPIQE